MRFMQSNIIKTNPKIFSNGGGGVFSPDAVNDRKVDLMLHVQTDQIMNICSRTPVIRLGE